MAAILSTLGVMAVLDGLWLGVVARKFYRRHLGGVMAASPRWSAAILFYLLYAVGVWFFAVDPAVQNADPGEAARRGALLGLLAYGTYDLTNMATLKKWPLILTVVDMGWGSVMTAAVGWAATFVALQVG